MSPLALSLQFLQAQPDSRLVALARDGHEPAFEALVRRYRRELLSYCRRLQPHTGSAEDALQQTLLQAWRALISGAEVREVRPWLYRIAHNVTLNSARRTLAVSAEVPETVGGSDVDRLVELRLEARAALATMASLPTLQREAFVSATLNGVSHEDVAGALGLSSGAVRGLIYRARATLRAAAAVITPSPAVNWVIRRAEARLGRTPVLTEAFAGGGAAGMTAALAKGGAVLTLAGAVAGAGGLIVAPPAVHHHRSTRAADSASLPPPRTSAAGPVPTTVAIAPRAGRAVMLSQGARGGVAGVDPARRRGRGRGDRPRRPEHGEAARGSSHEGTRVHEGGSGGGAGGDSSNGSSLATTSANSRDGSSGSSPGGSGGGSGGDHGGADSSTSGSGDASTASTSDSRGRTSGSGAGDGRSTSGGGTPPVITADSVSESTSDSGAGSSDGSLGSGSGRTAADPR